MSEHGLPPTKGRLKINCPDGLPSTTTVQVINEDGSLSDVVRCFDVKIEISAQGPAIATISCYLPRIHFVGEYGAVVVGSPEPEAP